MQTHLISQLANQILDLIRTENMPPGARLIERRLADHLNVSRTPVRRALRALEADGVVGVSQSRGFVVASSPRARRPTSGKLKEDPAYDRIARDRLSGQLPEKVTSRSLAAHYRLTRAQLERILRRITNEGWIERLPGHGWQFLPMLTSLQSYEDSYRFRLTIEPAAILEPLFTLDRAALERCRLFQQRLIDGDIWRVSKGSLFDLNTQVHEAIITCSRNVFFTESLKRLNKVRRLIEYRQALDRERAVVRCKEHVILIDLLLEGDREKASKFMHQHLSSLSRVKVVERS